MNSTTEKAEARCQDVINAHAVDQLDWSEADHRLAAAVLGVEAVRRVNVVLGTSPERVSVYDLVIEWLVRRAVDHARIALRRTERAA